MVVRRMGMELKNTRIHRSQSERMIAGVAGGLAEYVDVDPTIVRLTWALAVLATAPIALLLYVICALIIPRETESHLV